MRKTSALDRSVACVDDLGVEQSALVTGDVRGEQAVGVGGVGVGHDAQGRSRQAAVLGVGGEHEGTGVGEQAVVIILERDGGRIGPGDE